VKPTPHLRLNSNFMTDVPKITNNFTSEKRTFISKGNLMIEEK